MTNVHLNILHIHTHTYYTYDYMLQIYIMWPQLQLMRTAKRLEIYIAKGEPEARYADVRLRIKIHKKIKIH